MRITTKTIPIVIILFLLACGNEGSNKPAVFTVTFNSLSGTPVESQSVPENGIVTKPNNPTCENYTFNGWFREASDATIWDFKADTVTGDMTLYAGWTYSSTTPEVFDNADRPAVETIVTDSTKDYLLIKPWNYNKDYNSMRKYPLVLSLHGSGAPTPYAQCFVYSDYDKKTFPCFFIGAHITTFSWGDVSGWLIGIMENLKATERIDMDRIYIIGFSMGGYGAYYVAKKYHDDYGQHIAGIVRTAGFSNGIEIADRTSIWDHVGLSDTTSGIVATANSSYQYYKTYSGNATAVESSYDDTVSYIYNSTNYSYARSTLTLTKNGIQIMKKSEYTGMQHDSTVTFKDPSVLEWLFNQSLKNR